jgi:MFS family permease
MRTPQNPAASQELSIQHRITVLAAAFLGWMFAGLQIALFVLIHRPAMISLMTRGSGSDSAPVNEQAITEWFAWYQAAFLLGAACGGWIFGVLGDRSGRTRALAFSILCYSLCTGACYFASSPGEMLVWRFLACLGVGGAWPNTVALVAEAWPAASRPFLAGVLGTAANVGQVAMGSTSLPMPGAGRSWRVQRRQ